MIQKGTGGWPLESIGRKLATLVGQAGEFPGEDEEVNAVAHENSGQGAEAEMLRHVGGVPIPLFGDDEDRRRGKAGERATDGDVDEEQAKGRVHKARARAELEEFAPEQDGAEGHGGGLGDERAEQRSKGKQGQPPARGRLAGDEGEDAHGDLHDGPAGGDGHDDDDEKRADVGDFLAEIMSGRTGPFADAEQECEGNRPEGEDGLDFPEKMKDHGGGAGAKASGQCENLRGEKGMDDGEEEDDGRDEIEGLGVDAMGQDAEDVDAVVVLIGFERRRERRRGRCLGTGQRGTNSQHSQSEDTNEAIHGRGVMTPEARKIKPDRT